MATYKRKVKYDDFDETKPQPKPLPTITVNTKEPISGNIVQHKMKDFSKLPIPPANFHKAKKKRAIPK
jgi:hypothetical protein